MRNHLPPHIRQTANTFLRQGLLALGCLAAALIYIFAAHIDATQTLAFEHRRPVVYRVLAPLAIRGVAAILPAAAAQAAAADAGPIGGAVRQLAPGRPQWGLATLIFLYAALLFALLNLDRLAGDLGYPPTTRWLALAVLGLTLLVLFSRYGYLYDLATLALFTWALSLLYRGQYPLYRVAFVLACLNKETAILLIPVYWLTRTPRPRDLWRLAEQLGLFLLVRSALAAIFANNPGVAVAEWHLPDFIRNAARLDMIAYHLGLLVLVGLACVGWKIKPRFLRVALVCILPALCVLYPLFGWPGEVRVFLEVAPVIALMLLPPAPKSLAGGGEVSSASHFA